MGRSYAEPSLRMSAGAIFTIICLPGKRSPLYWNKVFPCGPTRQCREGEPRTHKLVKDLQLDISPMLELIDGCRGDICPVQPKTREDLLAYSYKVAACVGITSATVMGASEAAKEYAISLGYALQLVNILRDVAEDCRKYGRFYLPADDMKLFGVTQEDIRNQRYNYRMRQLLAYEAALAEKFFGDAETYYQQLSVEDRNALIA